jgi:hypothetical protein
MSDDAADQKSADQKSADQKSKARSKTGPQKPRETVLGNNAGVHIASESEDSNGEESARVDIPADFGSFIVSLGTNCMIHLGHIPHPETNEVERDLNSARHTIDLLEMLREKTEGNLVDEERKLIDSLIYDLKAAFVQETKAKN